MWWVLAGVVLVTLYIFSHIDNWGRDLTTNFASTDSESDDLRPARIELPPQAAAELIRRAAAKLPGWALAEPEPQQLNDGSQEWHFVRTTRVMRYKDDVHVRLEPIADGSGVIAHIRSRSRVGKGDLGQNPRNIRELLGRIEAESSGS